MICLPKQKRKSTYPVSRRETISDFRQIAYDIRCRRTGDSLPTGDDIATLCLIVEQLSNVLLDHIEESDDAQ